MAVICIVATVSERSIGDLNGTCQLPTKANESIEGCRNLLSAIENGSVGCNVQITVRDTAPSISTSGTGSTQDTYTK